MRSTPTPERPRRARRLRAIAWTTAGLTSALLLIGGSLAALDGEVLDGGSWYSYPDGDGEAIILAPAEGPAGTGGIRGPVDVLAAPEEPQPSLADSGGEVAPGEAPAIQADPVDEATTPPATGTEAQLEASATLRDADGDGLANRTEYRVRSNPRSSDTDANGTPDGLDDGDGDGLPVATEEGLGTDPAARDSDGGGQGDGGDDSGGDGRTNAEESAQGDDPGAPQAGPAETAP